MNFPENYSMCCQEECQEREKAKEVSVFEATRETAQRKPHKIDPRLAVQKYRRSAAGTTRSSRVRSRKQLRQAVNYLLELLATQKPLNSSELVDFLSTVSFFEDRIRAVQVDLVRSEQRCSEIQLRIIRAHILILYLTLDSKEYARKFGLDALVTALSAYWQAPDENFDEVLSIEVLLGVVSHFENKNEPLLSRSVTIRYRRIPERKIGAMPVFRSVMNLVSYIQLGHWRVALKAISGFNGHWGLLVRCVLAPVLPKFRYLALCCYNSCFWGKVEGITGDQLARLMSYDDDNSTMKCGPSALREAMDYGIKVEDDLIRFKTAPVQVYSKPSELRQDSFCLKEDFQDCRVDKNGIRVPDITWIRRFTDGCGAY